MSPLYVDGTILLRSQATSCSCVTFFKKIYLLFFPLLVCVCYIHYAGPDQRSEFIIELSVHHTADSHFDCSSRKIKINKEAVTALLIASNVNLFERLKAS